MQRDITYSIATTKIEHKIIETHQRQHHISPSRANYGLLLWGFAKTLTLDTTLYVSMFPNKNSAYRKVLG